MKNHLLLSLAVAGFIVLAGAGMQADAAPQSNNGMPGIAVSGSHNYSKIPEKARKFVEKHFKRVSVSKCEQYFAKGKYEVELSDGTDIEFDSNGNVLEIDARDNSYLAPAVVKDLLHNKAYSHLERKGLAGKVESIEFRKGKSVEVEVGIPDPDTFVFDINGNFLVVED